MTQFIENTSPQIQPAAHRQWIAATWVITTIHSGQRGSR